jgi:hypothetical protein
MPVSSGTIEYEPAQVLLDENQAPPAILTSIALDGFY